MANLSAAELGRAVALLSGALGFDRLKDRLARIGAFTSKRGLGSVTALADRLYMLTGGLRRESPASYGFHHVWGEVFVSRIGEDGEKALGDIAERINRCLDGSPAGDLGSDPEPAASLDEELASYHRVLAKEMGDEAARLDMLMKAVPAVAERIRAWPGHAPPGARADDPSPPTDDPTGPDPAGDES
jgi:hypothetical protein